MPVQRAPKGASRTAKANVRPAQMTDLQRAAPVLIVAPLAQARFIPSQWLVHRGQLLTRTPAFAELRELARILCRTICSAGRSAPRAKPRKSFYGGVVAETGQRMRAIAPPSSRRSDCTPKMSAPTAWWPRLSRSQRDAVEVLFERCGLRFGTNAAAVARGAGTGPRLKGGGTSAPTMLLYFDKVAAAMTETCVALLSGSGPGVVRSHSSSLLRDGGKC